MPKIPPPKYKKIKHKQVFWSKTPFLARFGKKNFAVIFLKAYLIFVIFLHSHIFRPENFTPKSA